MNPKKHSKVIAVVMGVSCLFLFLFLFVPSLNTEGFESPIVRAIKEATAEEEEKEARKKTAAAAAATATATATTRNNKEFITKGDIASYEKVNNIKERAGNEKLNELIEQQRNHNK